MAGPGAPARPRGRFAPSPTGPLHFGSLVAALASCCDARHAGGDWLVRIEDVDEPRTRPGAEDAILRTLERYGFAWDGAVVRQSDRIDLYEEALDRLRRQAKVFACACTRRSLAEAPVGPFGEHVYPGTCRDGIPPTLAGNPGRAWRIRVPPPGADVIEFVDGLQGRQRQHLATDVGDFVVKRADGLFAYQLAVVVDDAAQGITDVVRGADLLASTARQIFLYRTLGYAEPRWLHVPVADNRAGEKLSKQTRAPALDDANPLPALLAAWRFLAQPSPPAPPDSVAAFWAWAVPRWSRAHLPPVPLLPAPAHAASRQGPAV